MAPAIISHRGLCRTRPRSRRRGENTLDAFAAGIDALVSLGIPPAIEFDVRRAADGRLVVIHDATLRRAFAVRGRVSAHTAGELGELGVPRLEAVLERFGAAELHLEIKERGIAAAVASTIRSAADRIVVSSFLWKQLPPLRRHCRIALTSMLPTRRLVRAAVDMGAWAIHPDYRRTTARLVVAAHEAGLRVNAWTVNSPRAYGRMTRIGVDAVFSDNPFFLAARRD